MTLSATLRSGHSNMRPRGKSRILFIDHCALLSGGEIAMLNLVKTLDRARYEPIVLLGSDGPLVDELRTAGIETHVLPLDPAISNARKDALGIGTLSRVRSVVRAMSYARQVKQFIQSNRIDLVHTNSLKADILGGVAARLARRPLIWHVRDRIADDYLPASVTWAFRVLCHLIPQVVIANSGSTLDSVHRWRDDRAAVVYSGTRSREVDRSVVHDGLNALYFQPGHVGSPNLGTQPVIALLGRISPWKGQDVFVRAAAIVLRQYPMARFRIIGKVMFDEAAYERDVHALVDQLGIGASVEFSGFRSDVATALSELTLLVHASTTGEPFGQVIVEGMAAALPIVATDGGGVPEIVVHGETGLLVPMKDADAMAAAIIRILADPVSAREMGRKGQIRAREVFSIEKTARAVEAIYHRLLRDRD